MSSLQFMNQDGEWESYPDVDVLDHYKMIRDTVKASGITTRCCLCNESIPYKDIKVNLTNKSWSCSKCHAVNGLTKP